MTAKILVALDGSKVSESILPYVESLLRYPAAKLTLATVRPPGNEVEQLAGSGYLKEIAARLKRRGAPVDTEVLVGRPAEALTAYAAGGRYDLLALCSRGKRGLKRLLFGSTAEAVLHAATTPVLVVPPASRGEAPAAVRKIVLPLDGSHRSAAILEPAAALATAFGAKLCFVTVVASSKKNELPVETVAHNLFRDQKAMQKAGLEVEVAVLYGDPVRRIAEFAEENGADLVALASHGRTGLDKVFFGNTAESLLRRIRRPLLVVRTLPTPRTAATGLRALQARRRAVETFSMAGSPPKSPYQR